MRIIAGTYKGRPLTPLPGTKTRPTTDRVKEAWASSLLSILTEIGKAFEDVTVLDAFAGSGALGLELLSRGAKACVFTERDRSALNVINKNIKQLGIPKTHATVLKTDSLSPKLFDALATQSTFELVILDPPYSTAPATIGSLLNNLAAGGKLTENTVVSYEHAANSKLETLDGLVLVAVEQNFNLNLVRSRKYGTMCLDYFVIERA